MADRRTLAVAAGVVLVLAGACSAAVVRGSAPAGPPAGGREVVVRDGSVGTRGVGDAPIRVALSTSATGVAVGAESGWRITAGGGLVARGEPGESWRVERDGRRIRAVRPDGVPTVWEDGAIVVRADDDGIVRYGRKRYRGELVLQASSDGILVVNRLPIDDYLMGVIPLEIGTNRQSDFAAIQAQAVAARSYAATNVGRTATYDLTGGVLDQVYGGVDAETAAAREAVESTRGLVLTYGGRVVNAPYHSTCGGTTAGADELWRTQNEPYLRSVSDRIPGTDRFYCDIAPRFRWTRTYDRATLDAVLRRYLAHYAAVPGGNPGRVEAIEVESRTASGRVGTLHVATDRGNFVLRGNDIRFVLRSAGGEMLNSTYFSVETSTSRGVLRTVTLRGRGYGHGVGMCQWGAIGRSRAGQDYREILAAYYPGTTVAVLQ